MVTIKEDYVSFETAKLLKEKGFDARCPMIYTADGEMLYTDVKHHNMYAVTNKQLEYYTDIIAPSQAIAIKWLREVHKIFIEISVSIDLNGEHHYSYSILNRECKYVRKGYTDFDWNYEQACETAIKYCLENLI